MKVNHAAARAATASEAELCRAYAAAIALGMRNTACAEEEERTYGTLRLLTLATLRLPDLFLYAHVLQAFEEDPEFERVPLVVIHAVRTIAAGALRLAHRALEAHAGDVGYQTSAWTDRVLVTATAWLASEAEGEVPLLLDQARRAAIALTRATAATADQRMLVPQELAGGLAHLLTIHLVASTIG